MNPIRQAIIGVGIIIAMVVLPGVFYIVNETEQVILTQFGEPIGEPEIGRAHV